MPATWIGLPSPSNVSISVWQIENVNSAFGLPAALAAPAKLKTSSDEMSAAIGAIRRILTMTILQRRYPGGRARVRRLPGDNHRSVLIVAGHRSIATISAK